MDSQFIKYTACFTGHRPQLLGGYDENNEINQNIKNQLEVAIIDLIKNKGIKFFISGGALGTDLWSAEIILKLKKDYQIKLFIAQPFPSQSSKWNQDQIIKYNEILKRADKVIPVSPDPYSSAKMMKRNRFMIDRSDWVIAVFNGDYKSGTGNCLKYAESLNKNILKISV